MCCEAAAASRKFLWGKAHLATHNVDYVAEICVVPPISRGKEGGLIIVICVGAMVLLMQSLAL